MDSFSLQIVNSQNLFPSLAAIFAFAPLSLLVGTTALLTFTLLFLSTHTTIKSPTPKFKKHPPSLFMDAKSNDVQTVNQKKTLLEADVNSSKTKKTRSRPKPPVARDTLGVPSVKIPTPTPTPKSPCFVHSYIDPSNRQSLTEVITKSVSECNNYGALAETAVSVREISKTLGQARIHSQIKTVMIVTKPGDSRLIKLTRELTLYLIAAQRYGKDHGVTVYVDKQLKDVKRFGYESLLRESPHVKDNLKFWTAELCAARPEIFNFVLTLGGDGTVLYTSWLFQRVVPPVMPFHLGSLGFLTNFDFANYRKHLSTAMDNGIRVNLRMRFTCTVYHRVANPDHLKVKAKRDGLTGEVMMQKLLDGKGSWEALEREKNDDYQAGGQDKDLPCFVTQAGETFEVLNDLVVDRGAGPYMSMLELFGDDEHLTTVQADGLVISTPTGSTAYSVSAGGSLVHPDIPALLITPICPHTLSFRPMLLPDSMELRICVPYNSRSTAWASFDGRGRVELKQGDHIKVTPSKFPFPTVCKSSSSQDWFNSVSRCLRWNERERQKSFVVVEDYASDSETEVESDSIKVDDGGKQAEHIDYEKPHNRGSGKKHHETHVFACYGKDAESTSSGSGDER